MGSWKVVKAQAAPWGPLEKAEPAESVGPVAPRPRPRVTHFLGGVCVLVCPAAPADTVSGPIRRERGFGRCSRRGRNLALRCLDAPGEGSRAYEKGARPLVPIPIRRSGPACPPRAPAPRRPPAGWGVWAAEPAGPRVACPCGEEAETGHSACGHAGFRLSLRSGARRLSVPRDCGARTGPCEPQHRVLRPPGRRGGRQAGVERRQGRSVPEAPRPRLPHAPPPAPSCHVRPVAPVPASVLAGRVPASVTSRGGCLSQHAGPHPPAPPPRPCDRVFMDYGLDIFQIRSRPQALGLRT